MIWLGGRVVMQRIANPSTPVRFRPEPPIRPTVAASDQRVLHLRVCDRYVVITVFIASPSASKAQ